MPVLRFQEVRCCSKAVSFAMAASCLSACSAMGELAYRRPWSWIAATVVVLVVAGFIVSRMRR